MKKFIELLKEIGDLPLVSGFENLHIEGFKRIIEREVGENVEEIERNIVRIGNQKQRIVFVAHYDEIGFVVDNQYRKDLYRTIPVGLISWEMGYGKIFQTKVEGKIVKAIGSSPLPHSEVEEKRLFLEMEREIEIPPLWPFTYENRVIEINDMIFSKSLDDRVGTISILNVASKNSINFILTAGEEQGTTRLEKTLKFIESKIKDPLFVVIDAAFSSKDEHYGGIDEPKLAYISIEGGGKGNIAKKEVKEYISHYVDEEITTKSKAEVTDATTLYRKGKNAIAIVYPVRYLHSSLEGVNKKVVYNVESIIREIAESENFR